MIIQRMLRLFGKNPFLLFYLVFGYIIVFSLWWGYLLVAKNETAFSERMELDRISYETKQEPAPYLDSEGYLKLASKYKRQRVMILTEGIVFLVLQILGLWQVRRIFAREIELAAQQRNFLHSITHELKSPLSSVKITFQTLMKRVLEPEQKDKILNNAMNDVIRLESLVDNLLFAAKIERDTHGFSNEELNLSEIVQTVAQKFVVNKKEILIHTTIQEHIYYSTDLLGFTSVVMNLVENAIKYSPEGTTLSIQLVETTNKVTIEVKDEGYGIADEEKEKVFDKFYRIGSEDTRKTKGTGLGLFIVKRFVEIYKGNIVVKDNEPTGSIFTLDLPK